MGWILKTFYVPGDNGKKIAVQRRIWVPDPKKAETSSGQSKASEQKAIQEAKAVQAKAAAAAAAKKAAQLRADALRGGLTQGALKSRGSVAPKVTSLEDWKSVLRPGSATPPPLTDNRTEKIKNAAWEALRVKNSEMLTAMRPNADIASMKNVTAREREQAKIVAAGIATTRAATTQARKMKNLAFLDSTSKDKTSTQAGIELERLTKELREDQKAGVPIDPEYVAKLDEAYKNHVIAVQQEFAAKVEEIKTHYTYDAKGNVVAYKTDKDRKDVQKILDDPAFKAIEAEYARQNGDGVIDPKTQKETNPGTIRDWGDTRTEIEQAQRDYLFQQAQLTVFNKVKSQALGGGLMGSKAALATALDWQDQRYMLDVFKDKVDPATTGYNVAYDAKTQKMVSTKRTIDEEFEVRRAEYIAELERQYAKWQNEQALNKTVGILGSGYAGKDLPALAAAAKSLGMSDSPYDPASIQKVVKQALSQWELDNQRLFFPQARDRVLTDGEMSGQGGGNARMYVPGATGNTANYSKYVAARQEVTKRYYGYFGMQEPGPLDRPLEGGVAGSIWDLTVGVVPGAINFLQSGWGLLVGGLNAGATGIAGKPTAFTFTEGNLEYKNFPPAAQELLKAEQRRIMADPGWQQLHALPLERGGQSALDVEKAAMDAAVRGVGADWVGTPEGQVWAGEHGMLTASAGVTTGRNPVERQQMYDNLVKLNEDVLNAKDIGQLIKGLSEMGTNAISPDSAGLALLSGFLDPGNLIPLNFLTYINRTKYAVNVTKDMGITAKNLALAPAKWVTVSEMELNLEKEIVKVVKELGQPGADVAQITNRLLTELVGVKGKSQQERAIARVFQQMGLDPRVASNHQIGSMIQEVFLAQAKAKGLSHKSVADAARELEAKHLAEDLAKQAEDVRLQAADAAIREREALAKAEIEGEVAKLPRKDEALARLKEKADRVAAQRAARVTETPVHVEPQPTSVHVEPHSQPAHVPDAEYASTTPGHSSDPVIAKIEVEDEAVIAKRRDADIAASEQGYRDAADRFAARAEAEQASMEPGSWDGPPDELPPIYMDGPAPDFLKPPKKTVFEEADRRVGYHVMEDDFKYAGPDLESEVVHGGAFAAGDAAPFFASPRGAKLAAIMDLPKPTNPNQIGKWEKAQARAQMAIWEEGRRSMAQSIARREGNVTRLMPNGEVEYIRGAAQGSSSGWSTPKQYIATQLDTAQRAGLKEMENSGQYFTDIAKFEALKRKISSHFKAFMQGKMTVAEYRNAVRVEAEGVVFTVGGKEIPAGEILLRDLSGGERVIDEAAAALQAKRIKAIDDMADELIAEWKTYQKNLDEDILFLEGRGLTTEHLAREEMFMQDAYKKLFDDLAETRRQVRSDLEPMIVVSPATLDGYYQTLTLLPRYDVDSIAHTEWYGVDDISDFDSVALSQDSALDQGWRRGLGGREFAQEFRAGFMDPPNSPKEFRDKAQWLFSLFHMTLLDGDTARFNEYRKVIQTILRSNVDPENIYARMWQVMETRAGYPGAKTFADAEDAFIHAALYGGGLDTVLHPHMALAMIPYGPMARTVPTRYGWAHLLEDLPLVRSRLFPSAPAQYSDEMALGEITRIGGRAFKYEEGGIPVAHQIMHYVSTRYGDTFRRMSFSHRMNDWGLYNVVMDAKLYSQNAAWLKGLRENYYLESEIKIMAENGGKPLTASQKRTIHSKFNRTFGRDAKMAIKDGKNPEFAQFRQQFIDAYWEGQVTHSNPGLHTLMLYFKLQQPHVQMGQQWQHFMDIYLTNMVAAGYETMGREVASNVFARQIAGWTAHAEDVVKGGTVTAVEEVAPLGAQRTVLEKWNLLPPNDVLESKARGAKIVDDADWEIEMRDANDAATAAGPRYGEASQAPNYKDASLSDVETDVVGAVDRLTKSIPAQYDALYAKLGYSIPDPIQMLDAPRGEFDALVSRVPGSGDPAKALKARDLMLESATASVDLGDLAFIRKELDKAFGITTTPLMRRNPLTKELEQYGLRRETTRIIGTAEIEAVVRRFRREYPVSTEFELEWLARQTEWAERQISQGLSAMVRRTQMTYGFSDEAEQAMINVVNRVKAMPNGERILSGVRAQAGEDVMTSRLGQYLKDQGFFRSKEISEFRIKENLKALHASIVKRFDKIYKETGKAPPPVRLDKRGATRARQAGLKTARSGKPEGTLRSTVFNAQRVVPDVPGRAKSLADIAEVKSIRADSARDLKQISTIRHRLDNGMLKKHPAQGKTPAWDEVIHATPTQRAEAEAEIARLQKVISERDARAKAINDSYILPQIQEEMVNLGKALDGDATSEALTAMEKIVADASPDLKAEVMAFVEDGRAALADMPTNAETVRAAFDPEDLPLGRPSKPGEGWKIHLAVDPANYDAVEAELKAVVPEGRFKKLHGGEHSDGKDFTIYVGSRDGAMAVARHLDKKVGNLLSAPPTGAGVLRDDVVAVGDVRMRFDVGRQHMAESPQFHQYGSDGIPITMDDAQAMSMARHGSGYDHSVAIDRAHNALVKRYGKFYEGSDGFKPVASSGPAPATPRAIQDAYDAGDIAKGQQLNKDVAEARGGTEGAGAVRPDDGVRQPTAAERMASLDEPPPPPPPSGETLQSAKITKQQRMLEILSGMDEQMWLNREARKARKALGMAKTGAQRRAAWERLRRVAMANRVRRIAASGGFYTTYANRKQFANTMEGVVHDRVIAMFPPRRITSYAGGFPAMEVEQARTYYTGLLTSVVDPDIGRVPMSGATSVHYTRMGPALDAVMDSPVAPSRLEGLGIWADQTGPLSAMDLLAWGDELGGALKRPGFNRYLKNLEARVEKRLQEMTGDAGYTLKQYIADRLSVKGDFYEVGRFEKTDHALSEALSAERGAKGKSWTDLPFKRGEKPPDEVVHTTEVMDRDLEDVFTKIRTLKSLGEDPHQYNEARKVLRSGYVRKMAATKVGAKVRRAANADMLAAGIKKGDKGADEAYQAAWDKHWAVEVQKEVEQEAMRKFRELAGGTMFNHPVSEIIEEFENLYGYTNEVIAHEPRVISTFQQRTLEEAIKVRAGIADLSNPRQVQEGLSRFGQHPPFENRTARREWLVKYGFFTPRTKEMIESGHKSWSMVEEAEWWRTHWGRIPDDTNPDLYRPGGLREGVAHDEIDYIAQMLADGVYEQNMAARFAKSTMTKEQQIRVIVYGDPVLGVKSARDLELERRYVVERFGDLYTKMGPSGKSDFLTAFPWLMNRDEMTQYFIDRASKSIAPELLQHEWEMRLLYDMIANRTRKFVDEFVLAGKETTHEDLMRVVVDVTTDLLSDPLWLKRSRDSVGDLVRATGKIRRGLVMTMLGFGTTNVTDSAIRGAWISWRDRSFLNHGMLSADANGFTLAHFGQDQSTQLVRDTSRPLGTTRIKSAWDEDKGLDLLTGAATIPLQMSAAAERSMKLRLMKEMYDPVYAAALRRFKDPDLARVFALKYTGERIARMWPTQGNGPIERLVNNLMPFASYQFKNHVLFIGEIARHPAIYLWLDKIGDYIEAKNVERWSREHPKEEMKPSEKRLIELPWAPGEFIDLGNFTDFQRGRKPLDMAIAKGNQLTPMELGSQFVRLASANDINIAKGIMNYFQIAPRKGWVEVLDKDGYGTGVWNEVELPQEAPWGGTANALNSIWPIQLGADFISASKDGLTLTEMTRLAYSTLFMGSLKPYDEGAGLNRYYMALRDQSPAKAKAFLLTPEGKKLKVWWLENAKEAKDFKTPEQLKKIMNPDTYVDTNPWFHSQTEEYQTMIRQQLNEKYELGKKWDHIIWSLTPGTKEYTDAKLQAATERYVFYAQHPELYKYDAFSKTPEEWAKTLDQWHTDALVERFFAMEAPQEEDFKDKAAYVAAYNLWKSARMAFLLAFPKVAAVVQGAKDGLEGVQTAQENEWFRILDEIGTRDIALVAAHESANYPLSDQLYAVNELQYERLNEDQITFYFDPTTDFKTLPDGKQGPLQLAAANLIPKVKIMPDFNQWRWSRANEEERSKILANQRYAQGMGEIIAKAKASKNFGATFVAEIKKDPWLRDRYFAQPGNETKKHDWAETDEYISLISKYGKLMTAGKFNAGYRYFDSLPAWVKVRYFAKDRVKRVDAMKTQEYMNYMGKWVDFYRKRDYAGAAAFFDKMPQWVQDRYSQNHSKTSQGKGNGGNGSAGYMKAMGTWVGLLKKGDDAGAKKFFDSMPQAYRDRYYKKHPDQKLRNDIKRVGQLTDYFAADDANRAQYLQDNPSFAKWLKDNSKSDAQRIMMITVAYQSIPKSEAWLRRVFREKYPEVFSKDASGAATLKKIYTALATHPEMTPAFEKWVKAIWDTYAENAKHTAAPPKPIVWDHSPQREKSDTSRLAPHHGYSAAWVRIH